MGLFGLWKQKRPLPVWLAVLRCLLQCRLQIEYERGEVEYRGEGGVCALVGVAVGRQRADANSCLQSDSASLAPTKKRKGMSCASWRWLAAEVQRRRT